MPFSAGRYIMRREHDLFVPKYNSVYGKRSIEYLLASTWNTVPEEIRAIENIKNFSAKLKQYLQVMNVDHRT